MSKSPQHKLLLAIGVAPNYLLLGSGDTYHTCTPKQCYDYGHGQSVVGDVAPLEEAAETDSERGD
ncbi:hypothetical protein Taro_027391 [Colocasia esculenta]|uniref:Uncharacterized protein n=1 Tax=Colocasia esculenta TaxID=4460 RepID=A0A843VDT6_COLES|nr:hypothetical protein [Colocasia esculenta]